jgi:hypothetical protein
VRGGSHGKAERRCEGHPRLRPGHGHCLLYRSRCGERRLRDQGSI